MGAKLTGLQGRIQECLARAREHAAAAETTPSDRLQEHHREAAAEWQLRAYRLEEISRAAGLLIPPQPVAQRRLNKGEADDVPTSRQPGKRNGGRQD